MAETVSLDFLGAQMERLFARLDRIEAGQEAIRDDIRVLTAIVLRHENTLKDILGQVSAMVAQHARFNDRLRRLEEQPAQ
jgi:transposase